MRLKCIKTRLSEIKPLILFKSEGPENIHDDDYYISSLDYYTIDKKTSGYNLLVEQVYDVFGMMYFNNSIRYLTVTENDPTPQWYPSELFEILESRLPYDWYCNTFVSNSEIGMIVGYKELANDYNYILDLMQASPNAISIFNNIKATIEYL